MFVAAIPEALAKEFSTRAFAHAAAFEPVPWTLDDDLHVGIVALRGTLVSRQPDGAWGPAQLPALSTQRPAIASGDATAEVTALLWLHRFGLPCLANSYRMRAQSSHKARTSWQSMSSIDPLAAFNGDDLMMLARAEESKLPAKALKAISAAAKADTSRKAGIQGLLSAGSDGGTTRPRDLSLAWNLGLTGAYCQLVASDTALVPVDVSAVVAAPEDCTKPSGAAGPGRSRKRPAPGGASLQQSAQSSNHTCVTFRLNATAVLRGAARQ